MSFGSSPAFLSILGPIFQVVLVFKYFSKQNLSGTFEKQTLPAMDGPTEASTHEEVGPAAGVSPPAGARPGLHPPHDWNRPLPFQVFQQEEESDEVGVGQGAEQMHHAVFLGSRV